MPIRSSTNMSFFSKHSPPKQQHQAFSAFYALYAPTLWGLILAARLPADRSKTILANTFINAWRHPDRSKVADEQFFSWLMRLAYAEGLPANSLRYIFRQS